MTVIKPEIEAAVAKELDAATQIHGLHNSLPEQYAVTLEEVEEAREALERITEDMDEIWQCLRRDNAEGANYYLHEIADHAVELACEAVQVAAMATKKIKTLDVPTLHLPQARWEICSSGGHTYCTNCDAEALHGETTEYCPYCGCLMVEPKGAEE